MTIHAVSAAQAGRGRTEARGPLCAATFLILLSFAQLAQADDRLRYFQNAINYMQDEKGCLSIPYPDRQDSCQRKQDEVTKFCKESSSSCGDMDPKRIQKEIEKVKTERDALKAQKEDLERQRSSLTDDQAKREVEDKLKEIERKLYELDRTRGDLERQVSEATKEVNDRLYVAKACRDARLAVQEVFRDARSRAYDESDAEIRPLARRLAEFWEKGDQKHEQSVANAKAAVENCDKTLYEIGHLGSF